MKHHRLFSGRARRYSASIFFRYGIIHVLALPALEMRFKERANDAVRRF